MTKKDLMDRLARVQDNERVNMVVNHDNEEEPIEEGDILEVVDHGYMAALGHVLYVQKV